MRTQTQHLPIILALDVPSPDVAMRWVERLYPRISFFKVGMQLFYAAGPSWVNTLRQGGAHVFLDLKLHDIPNTVAKACESVLQLTPRFLTLHTAGGLDMMQAAQKVVEQSSTQLLGVTQLTSMSAAQRQHTYCQATVTNEAWVSHLAHLARQAGLKGLVCSAHENPFLRRELGDQMTLVNPGIRLAQDSVDDQVRVATPQQALQSGANWLVIGRPILHAPDVDGVLAQLQKELAGATGLSC